MTKSPRNESGGEQRPGRESPRATRNSLRTTRWQERAQNENDETASGIRPEREHQRKCETTRVPEPERRARAKPTEQDEDLLKGSPAREQNKNDLIHLSIESIVVPSILCNLRFKTVSKAALLNIQPTNSAHSFLYAYETFILNGIDFTILSRLLTSH